MLSSFVSPRARHSRREDKLLVAGGAATCSCYCSWRLQQNIVDLLLALFSSYSCWFAVWSCTTIDGSCSVLISEAEFGTDNSTADLRPSSKRPSNDSFQKRAAASRQLIPPSRFKFQVYILFLQIFFLKNGENKTLTEGRHGSWLIRRPLDSKMIYDCQSATNKSIVYVNSMGTKRIGGDSNVFVIILCK